MGLWKKLFAASLNRMVQKGHLRVVFPDGTVQDFGQLNLPRQTMRIHTTSALRHLVIYPELALGEAYMDGAVTVDDDALTALLCLFMDNMKGRKRRLQLKLRRLFRRVLQYNPVGRARRNAAHHYDLSQRLYRLFLDDDLQYSCAYFPTGLENLQEAQRAKKALIAKKLLLKMGQKVLDIGCGWGGLDLYLAKKWNVEVTGITLSREQQKVADIRAQSLERGVKRPEFRVQDYRKVGGRFDRIVSIGMFEHVGVPHYGRFFNALAQRLSHDGVALLHTIGRVDGPGTSNPWVAKYIFPGGYVPALSEILPHIEDAGLIVTDIEVWRLHYAETLKAWRQRFHANLARARDLYDERFCRMWHFYLAASEASFRKGGLVVFQIQLARRQGDVPLTRDYLYVRESDAAVTRRVS